VIQPPLPHWGPSGGPSRRFFFRELLDHIFLVYSGQEPSFAQPELISWFGWDSGKRKDKRGKSAKSRSHGFPVHARWALTFVCHYLILHYEDTPGFIQELKERSNFYVRTIRNHYPSGHFADFDPGTLLDVLHLPLTHKKVRLALKRAIRKNFVTNSPWGTITLDKIDIAKISEIVDDALRSPKGPSEVKHPGRKMTLRERAFEQTAPQERTRLIYAHNCAKGVRHV
jgi:hypothetical protein